jgi:hypothetical protein
MRRRPIGQILVEKGEISPAELQAALDEQERTGLKLGQILIETGRISWLALARAIAEQVLDIEGADAPDANGSQPQTPPPAPVREQAPAPGLPPLPTFTPVARPAQVTQPVQPLQAAPAPAPAPAPGPAPAPVLAPQPAALDLLHDPEIKLHSVEALLKERQRAFIELVTTTETLRMKVARLEEIIDERDRELTKLRVLRAG